MQAVDGFNDIYQGLDVSYGSCGISCPKIKFLIDANREDSSQLRADL